ncbi:MAG: hypothetical protein ACFN4F_07230 [Porphyromonas endodontalis]|uniref:hypothetical protein n=1 Tax=Porphyromonas endodontalis TaxID=28124 RepID=UPI0028EF8BE8|nr:hypothetical protein [Porphyromonas endodontalis]
MGLFFFFNNQRARRFEHKPIYWNQEREALEERVARIRKELEEKGEISPDKEVDLYNTETLLGKQIAEHEAKKKAQTEEHRTQFADELHSSMLQNMRHLSQQEEKGISGRGRINEILKILLVLLVLGVLVWFLYYKQ